MAIVDHTSPTSVPVDQLQREAQPRRFVLTIEQVAYIALMVVALGLRLWALGDRAMHHDETHHANFSWQLYQGNGYVHDPLLHGPFLYHLGAFLFFLFGDSNTTARLGTALFGVILVGLPYLLRREIGRFAALLAAAYLTFSPVVLYVNRFIRHDTYTVVFELLTLIAIVRYAGDRRPIWLIIACSTLALMLTNMATFYLYVAIFAPLLALIFFWKVWKPGIALSGLLAVIVVLAVFWLPGKPVSSGTIIVDSRTFLYYVITFVVAALSVPWVVRRIRARQITPPVIGMALLVLLLTIWSVIPHAPVEKSGGEVTRVNGSYVCPSANNPTPPDNPINAEPGPLLGLPPLPTADNAYALCVRNQWDSNFAVYFAKLGQFFLHPAILLGAFLASAVLAVIYWFVWQRRDVEGTTAWQRAVEQEDQVVAAFASLGADRRLWVALGLGFTFYTLLFTAFFTNPTGVVSGAAGSLLYWLAQHDVRRGGQPDYFYLVTLSIYEPLLVVWGVIGLVFVGRRIAYRLSHEYQPPVHGGIDWQVAMPIILAWWAVGTFLIYSWAGEKMPWLTIRSAVPLTLLSAWAFARMLRWWRGQYLDQIYPTAYRRDLWAYLAAFATVLTIGFILMAFIARPDSLWRELVVYVPLLILSLSLLVLVGAWALRGSRWALGACAIAVSAGLAMGELRSSYQLNYRWGDTPREMMIYTQTSPDVERTINRLAEASIRRGGNLDLPIWYDGETVWSWYMRRFTNAQQQGMPLRAAPPANVQVVFMMSEYYADPSTRTALEGFRIQRYPLRWWFPEDQTYRLPSTWATDPVSNQSPLLMRVLRQPNNSTTLIDFWQFLVYRRPPAPLGASDFVVAVRPELAEELGPGFGSR